MRAWDTQREDRPIDDDDDDVVTVTIEISRKAYENAEQRSKDPRDLMGELAGFVSADDYIERMAELYLVSLTAVPACRAEAARV